MLITPGLEAPAFLGVGQHMDRSLVIVHDLGFASQIVREIYQAKHRDPPPLTTRRETLGLVHSLAVTLQEIRKKLFEVEYPRPIEVVFAASFGALHQIFAKLSTRSPLDMAHPASKAQDIHLCKIFTTFGLVCKAC